ncbi:hypothetical protein [Petrachloros mirabilis]
MKTDDIDADLLESLGRICVHWSVVEAHLGALLAHMMTADHLNMHLVTQSVSGKTITNWLRTLVDIYVDDSQTTELLREILRETDELASERNALVHGLWEPGPDKGTAIVNSLRLDRSEILKDEFTTTADLQDLIDRIREISAKLQMIGVHLGYYLS